MTSPDSSTCLIVFARNAVAGRVKTRLIPTLGTEGATRLHRAMTQQTLATAAKSTAQHRELWLDAPSHDDPPLDEWIGDLLHRYGMTCHEQRGNDLGRRMFYAMQCALQACAKVVLIGSDCPAIDPPFLTAAFRALNDHDVVLGPALDGGYVLIGARRLDQRLFDRVPWGTGEVLSTTRSRLSALNWSWTELPALRDVDDIDDLEHYPQLRALVGSAHNPTFV